MRQLGGKNNKMRQKLKILPNFGMKICFFSLFFVTLQPICANYSNRTWGREGVIGASEYSWSILAKSGGEFMITEKPQN